MTLLLWQAGGRGGGIDAISFDEAQEKLSFASYPSHLLLKDQKNNTVHWGLSAKGTHDPTLQWASTQKASGRLCQW